MSGYILPPSGESRNICQGVGQQVSGYILPPSGESTLGEHFTPRCEEKWPIKVPIFEGGPSIHPYFRGTLKKWPINHHSLLLNW